MPQLHEEMLRFLAERLPDLGDPNTGTTIILADPEINTLSASLAFVRSACIAPQFEFFWKHYGPTIEKLLRRMNDLDYQIKKRERL